MLGSLTQYILIGQSINFVWTTSIALSALRSNLPAASCVS